MGLLHLDPSLIGFSPECVTDPGNLFFFLCSNHLIEDDIGYDAEDIDRDNIADRLKQDAVSCDNPPVQAHRRRMTSQY